MVLNAKFEILAEIQSGWHQGSRFWTGLNPFGAKTEFVCPKISIVYQKINQHDLFSASPSIAENDASSNVCF